MIRYSVDKSSYIYMHTYVYIHTCIHTYMCVFIYKHTHKHKTKVVNY